MGYDFTQRQCINALLEIGFTKAKSKRSWHYKYRPPSDCKGSTPHNGVRPFITVPKHDFYCQDAIVREIRQLCGEEMKNRFLKAL